MDFLTYSFFLNLLTLTFLEIILGIDNLIFIAIVVHKLPSHIRKKARVFGLSLAMVIRILMLMTLSFIMSLTKPVFILMAHDFSWKDVLLIVGGLFLIGKSGYEIYNDAFKEKHVDGNNVRVKNSLIAAIMQISLIDFVFSFDSVITAVGITHNIPHNIIIIIIAIAISMIVMLIASEHVSNFLAKYSSLKIIALAFIFMIGVILCADGFKLEISKGYLYFALFFTLAVESLNIMARKKHHHQINH
ncbi:MAG: TerC family protein [Rickettsiales bacterium]|nr:TerC family protein [Rickettsiales bacterium]